MAQDGIFQKEVQFGHNRHKATGAKLEKLA
jgi:hypothetical protein